MTRNLYLGRISTGRCEQRRAVPGTMLLALGHANHELSELSSGRTSACAASCWPMRSQPPDPSVSLREVALWRHGPLQLDHLGRLDAVATDLTFWRSCAGP